MASGKDRGPAPVAIDQLVDRAELVDRLAHNSEKKEPHGHIFIVEESL